MRCSSSSNESSPSIGTTISLRLEEYDTTRTTKRQIDCTVVQADGSISDCDNRLQSRGGHADGQPDIDPETGFFLTEDLDSEVRSQTTRAFNILGKVNYALNPENQGQVAIEVAALDRRTSKRHAGLRVTDRHADAPGAVVEPDEPRHDPLGRGAAASSIPATGSIASPTPWRR